MTIPRRLHRSAIVACTGALLAFGATAYGAVTGYWSGGLCQPQNSTAGTDLGVGEAGATNANTSSSRDFWCFFGRNISTIDGSASAVVRVADANTTVPFWCYAFNTTEAFGYYWSSTKYSCSTAGGCPDSTSSFTGTTYLSWSNPFNLSEEVTSMNIGFHCSVPPTQSGNGTWIGRFQMFPSSP